MLNGLLAFTFSGPHRDTGRTIEVVHQEYEVIERLMSDALDNWSAQEAARLTRVQAANIELRRQGKPESSLEERPFPASRKRALRAVRAGRSSWRLGRMDSSIHVAWTRANALSSAGVTL